MSLECSANPPRMITARLTLRRNEKCQFWTASVSTWLGLVSRAQGRLSIKSVLVVMTIRMGKKCLPIDRNRCPEFAFLAFNLGSIMSLSRCRCLYSYFWLIRAVSSSYVHQQHYRSRLLAFSFHSQGYPFSSTLACVAGARREKGDLRGERQESGDRDRGEHLPRAYCSLQNRGLSVE